MYLFSAYLKIYNKICTFFFHFGENLKIEWKKQLVIILLYFTFLITFPVKLNKIINNDC